VATGELSWHKECVIVTGATGSIGPAIVEAFCEENANVLAIARHRPPRGLLPDNVEFVVGDITHPSTIDTIMPGATIVVHLAALLDVFNPSASLLTDYERVNVAGTRCVVESALRWGVRRLVFFSTISVYGPSCDSILDETSTTHPHGKYGETKLAAEKLVLEAPNADGQPLGSVLRLAAVYGPRIKGNYQRLVRALARRHFVSIGEGTNRRALIYEKDVGQAVLLAARHPAAAGQIFNLSDGQNHAMNTILDVICSALGRKKPRLRLPAEPVLVAASMLERGAGVFGLRSPIARVMIEKYLEDVVVDAKRIQTLLGFRPRYELITGWRETITRMKETGAI
jgi:nucleoside-diphosphate-sugar epimerase